MSIALSRKIRLREDDKYPSSNVGPIKGARRYSINISDKFTTASRGLVGTTQMIASVSRAAWAERLENLNEEKFRVFRGHIQLVEQSKENIYWNSIQALHRENPVYIDPSIYNYHDLRTAEDQLDKEYFEIARSLVFNSDALPTLLMVEYHICISWRDAAKELDIGKKELSSVATELSEHKLISFDDTFLLISVLGIKVVSKLNENNPAKIDT